MGYAVHLKLNRISSGLVSFNGYDGGTGAVRRREGIIIGTGLPWRNGRRIDNRKQRRELDSVNSDSVVPV